MKREAIKWSAIGAIGLIVWIGCVLGEPWLRATYPERDIATALILMGLAKFGGALGGSLFTGLGASYALLSRFAGEGKPSELLRIGSLFLGVLFGAAIGFAIGFALARL